MGQSSTFKKSPLAPSDPFQNLHSILHQLVGVSINKVRRGFSVLGYEYGFFGFMKLRQDLGSLSFQCCDNFSLHDSDTIVSLRVGQGGLGIRRINGFLPKSDVSKRPRRGAAAQLDGRIDTRTRGANYLAAGMVGEPSRAAVPRK